jgi:high-affinity Fe2+/Pb2+ permease
MGGRALRRKQKIVLIWAVIAGLITATIVAVAILWANSQAGGTN